MNVTISARDCEIRESLRARTAARIAWLERHHPRVADAEVTFPLERGVERVARRPKRGHRRRAIRRPPSPLQ